MQWPKVERVYSRRRFPQAANTNNTKYVPPHFREEEKLTWKCKNESGQVQTLWRKMGL